MDSASILRKPSLAYATETIYSGAECCRGRNKCCGARWDAQMGGWQSILGRAVRERRRELELTLDEASRAIGISRSHLNLIELGKATGVSGEAVAGIDSGLGCQGALVALLPPKDAAGVTRGEEMRRAEFNKAVVALAASLLLDRERLIGSENVDAALLEDHESLTRDFAHRQHHVRPQTILEPIRAHLNQLLSLENTSLSPSMRQRLDRVIAETAALAGWVAFRSNGDLVTAHAQLALGRQHAREAGDDMLLAQLLAATSSLHSSLDLPRRGEDQSSPLALSLLQAAQRKAGSGSLPVHGWIAVRLAMEQALLGDTRRARPLLGRAEATLPSQPSGDSAGLFVIWDESRFPGWAGKTLLLMRDPAATGLLEQALSMTTAPHPRLGLLVDLAMARMNEGDTDQAITLLVEGTQLAIERGIEGFARWRLQEGRGRLSPAQQRAFDSRLHAVA
jgi:transcriptional regulator with XRE-family HTH domain